MDQGDRKLGLKVLKVLVVRCYRQGGILRQSTCSDPHVIIAHLPPESGMNLCPLSGDHIGCRDNDALSDKTLKLSATRLAKGTKSPRPEFTDSGE